jgi:hypothetical protein
VSHYDLPLRKPADGVTPAGERYTYSANDVSVGDVDGDGRTELMTKTAPGTRDGRQRYITMPREDVRDGFGDTDDHRLSPEGHRNQDSTALRFYLSTEPTSHKMYTLMHDRQYRVEVARQQTTYNQPSYPSFYLASDVDWTRVPLPSQRKAAP